MKAHWFLSLIISIFLGFSSVAQAGDYAFENEIGFSQDGRYFAFEEYGIEDGSGFPYAHIFIIDLETDTFWAETPFRIRIKDENATLRTARQKVRKQAANSLAHLKIHQAASEIYARGLGDFSKFTDSQDQGLTTPLKISVFLPSFQDPTNKPRGQFDLVLRHIPVPSVTKCPLQTIGFQLEKRDSQDKRRFIHKDEKILLSRGCPLKYRISKVYRPAFKGDYAAVLMSVFQTGFEGANRRFIVLPVFLD